MWGGGGALGIRGCATTLVTGQYIVLENISTRGGSRGGVEGVATPPLSSICFFFCLICPKIIKNFFFLS